MVRKLSDHTLTEDEISVLTKCLSFVPTPTKTFKQETNKSWDKFKTRIVTQYFFRYNIHDRPPFFKSKFNWTHVPSDKSTLVDFFTNVEKVLTSINTPCRKTYSSLTLQEETVLRKLKNKLRSTSGKLHAIRKK